MFMRATLAIGLFLCALSCPLRSVAQQSVEGGRVGASVILPTGLRVPAILKSLLSSKKSKLGDPVHLEVVVDVHDKNGAVVMPRHAKLCGRVTSVVRYEKNKQPAMLAFVVESAEWKDHSATLDAPVFGTDVVATDAQKGEMVDGIRAATLRHADSLNLVSTETIYESRLSGNVPQALHDATVQSTVMQLKLFPDAAITSAFVKNDGDLELHDGFLVVLLNGMKVVD
jgi:hypothetical protein